MRRSTHASPAPREPTLDALMARHEGLVHTVLRQQWPGSLSYEDRLHAARIGLWQAVRQTTPRPAALPPRTACPTDPEASLLQQEVRQTLRTLVHDLPVPLRCVVVDYYGLADHPPQSLRQIARQMGVSHETVRLRLWAALVWLRHPAHSLPLRQLLALNTAADYEQADRLAQVWLRKRGGRRAR